MMNSAVLVAEISKILGGLLTSNYSAASAANDVFEGYTFAIAVEAARSVGASVAYETHDGTLTRNLIFRTSPGDIFSTARKYTHALVEFSKCPPLEIHIGVKVSGKSKVLHECDVAFIERHEAKVCRSSKVHPRVSKVLIAAECKFYSSTLPLGLARGYLGLAEELTKKNRLLVTNTTSDNAAKMVAYHQAGWQFDLSAPTASAAKELQLKFVEALRNYIAMNKA